MCFKLILLLLVAFVTQECWTVVRKKLRQESLEDFQLVEYEIMPLSATSGYMGQYFKLRVTVTNLRDTAVNRIIEFFLKLPPSEQSPQHEFNEEMGSFHKEVAIYTTVFPEVLTSPLNKTNCVPECYLGLEDGIIVLEDMAYRGFVMPDKHVPFDFEHCAVMMRTIGKFHASSMIFEEIKRKSLYKVFSHCMHETLWPLKGKLATNMFRAAVKGSISLVNMISELSDNQKSKLKDEIANLSRDHARKLLPSDKFKNVLCHGDLWANNLLFKYDNNDGRKPIDCCLIDFQLARYNPPAHDIMCFLQFSTTRKLRSERLPELLHIYHDSVSDTLRASKLDAAHIFPWKELENSVAELQLVCMLHGILNAPIMLLDESTVSKYFVDEPKLLEQAIYVDRTPLVCGQFSEVPAYRQRIKDAILEFNDRLFHFSC